MNATVQHGSGVSRSPVQKERAVTPVSRTGRLAGISAHPMPPPSHQWPVDLTALARCRALLTGHGSIDPSLANQIPHVVMMDVPGAYDAFCRAHFASVRRMHSNLSWEDAMPAYAVALSAHAVLCKMLEDGHEQLLAASWQTIRGNSHLTWQQARPLVGDGCRALDRIDPLSMHR